MNTEFKHVPLGLVWESKTNPRRHFSEQGMQELTASVKASGILVPLIVVEDDDGFEIVAGARRYRAAKAAGLTMIPVIVRDLTKEQVLEAQVIENLQREDVHPLDEAKGYETLMKVAKYDVGRVASSVGRSTKYIYDRVKLLALTPEAQELFWNEKITAGHAILLARLSASEQKRVIGDPKTHYEDSGLFLPEHGLYTDEQEEAHFKDAQAAPHVKPVSVRELQGYIDQHVRFDPITAEPMLFPETVQTVQAAVEEEEKVIHITHNYHVYPEAKDDKIRTYGPVSWTRADGQSGSKPCDHSVTGVIVVGPGRGEAFKVCIEKQKCLVHWKKEIKAREAKQRGEGKENGNSKKDAHQLRREKQEAEYRRQEEARKQWSKYTPQIVDAVAAAVKKAPVKGNSLLASLVVERCIGYWENKNTMKLVPLDDTIESVIRHAAFAVLVSQATEWNAHESFPKVMKAFNLDPKKIIPLTDQPADAAKPEKKKGKGKAA
jgi:ParB family chromosome partitioning protein